MTSYWWVDRALPGLVNGVIMAAALAALHMLMRRFIRRTTNEQTAALSGSAPQTNGGTPMTAEAPAPPATEQPAAHRHVPHPRELLSRQPGISHRDLLPAGARGFLAKVSGINTRAAIFVCACYGSAAAVWLFALFAIVSGLAKGQEQITLLTWSNGVQLVFCAVGTLASIVTQKQGQAKADADHQAQTHIANQVDESKADLAVALDRLDDRTDGGIKAVLDAIAALSAKIDRKAPAA